jgi:hypothetical protein
MTIVSHGLAVVHDRMHAGMITAGRAVSPPAAPVLGLFLVPAVREFDQQWFFATDQSLAIERLDDEVALVLCIHSGESHSSGLVVAVS